MFKFHFAKFLTLLVVFIAGDAIAQQKLFAVSGQGRGSQADARQASQISKLESENQDRKTETTQNAADISDHETRISDNESELATIEPHAKEAQASCAAGDLIRWDGSTYTCVNESDPTVGEHALTTTVPPDCHDVNAKLLWNASTKQWHCALDNNDGSGGGWTGSEDDPQVGTLYNGRLCRTDGSQVICDSLAPQISGNDVVVGGNVEVGGDIIGQGATFTDPIAAGEPTASNHLTTKAYVDSVASGGGGGSGGSGAGGAFGNWEEKDFNTVYQADTDGFVIASCYGTGSAYAQANTGPTNPPDQVKWRSFHYASSSGYGSLNLPVKRGDYWRVTYPGSYPCTSPSKVFWLSFSGGGGASDPVCTSQNVGNQWPSGPSIAGDAHISLEECRENAYAAKATKFAYSGSGAYPVCVWGGDDLTNAYLGQYGGGCGSGNCWPNTTLYTCDYPSGSGGSGGLDIINCEKTTSGSSWISVSFSASDCGGTLPDTSYTPVLSSFSGSCGSVATVSTSNDPPGARAYCNSSGSLTFKVGFIR